MEYKNPRYSQTPQSNYNLWNEAKFVRRKHYLNRKDIDVMTVFHLNIFS